MKLAATGPCSIQMRPIVSLGTTALTRLPVRQLDIPVIAAGGIIDGAGIAAVLHLGAAAAQLGTAFVASPESAADEGYRAALASGAAHHTVMTAGISGRPARCLANRFTALVADVSAREIPAYPVTYDAGKALNAAAKARVSPAMARNGRARVRRWRERSLRPS